MVDDNSDENKPSGAKIKPFAARKVPRRITDDYLHNSGLYYLQRFAASSGHFRRVMARKIDRSCMAHVDQDREACIVKLDALVEKFQRAGLLNDEAYLAGSLTSLRRRGLSGRAIEARLSAKGVPIKDVKNALVERQTANPDADLVAALRLAQRKRLGPFARDGQEDAGKDKPLAALARAGFNYETANRALTTGRDTAEQLIAAYSGL